MKRSIALLLAAALMLCLAGCQFRLFPSADDEKKAEWESFIEEYNKFADEYVQIFEQYKENPTNLSILEDLSTFATRATDFADKAAQITKDLISHPEDAVKFAAELVEITKKLAKIVTE